MNLFVLFFAFNHFLPDEKMTITNAGIICAIAFVLTKIELVLIGFWKY